MLTVGKSVRLSRSLDDLFWASEPSANRQTVSISSSCELLSTAVSSAIVHVVVGTLGPVICNSMQKPGTWAIVLNMINCFQEVWHPFLALIKMTTQNLGEWHTPHSTWFNAFLIKNWHYLLAQRWRLLWHDGCDRDIFTTFRQTWLWTLSTQIHSWIQPWLQLEAKRFSKTSEIAENQLTKNIGCLCIYQIPLFASYMLGQGKEAPNVNSIICVLTCKIRRVYIVFLRALTKRIGCF